MTPRKIPTIVYLNLVLFFFVLLAIFFPEIRSSFRHFTSASKPIAPSKQSQAMSLQQSFRNVYSVSRSFVVSIRTRQDNLIFNPYQISNSAKDNFSSIGSGIIIDKGGFVLTNYHVIKDSNNIEVILPSGKIFLAEFVGSHERADIALLKIPPSDEYSTAKFGNSDEVEVGDWAIAMGSPFGLEKTFTLGVVSAKSREDLDETGQTHIQVDASINPGSSGGPLLNIYGEVIGINRMIRTASGQNAGISFAIPINYVKKVLKMIENNLGKNIRPATLGVIATVPFPYHRALLGIPESESGVLVYDIEPNSSADLSGLKQFDFIREVNNTQVKDIGDLREQVGLVGSGGLLKLEITRANRQMSIFVKLIETSPFFPNQ